MKAWAGASSHVLASALVSSASSSAFIFSSSARIFPGLGDQWSFARLRSGIISSSEAVAFTCCDNVTDSHFQQQMAWSTGSASHGGHHFLEGWSFWNSISIKKGRQGCIHSLGATTHSLLLSLWVKIPRINKGEKSSVIWVGHPGSGNLCWGEGHVIGEQRTRGQGQGTQTQTQ